MPLTSSASPISPGTVAHFAASTAPAGWIKANGALISRTAYAALFAAIGTTYGVGDGSTTFALPDLRGEFLRGLDDSRGVDPARVMGSSQNGSNQSHTHLGGVETNVGLSPGASSYFLANSLNAPSQASGGTESRPRNVALLACIKF